MRTIYQAAHITIDAFTYADAPKAASTITQSDTSPISPELDTALATATAKDTEGNLELTIVKHIGSPSADQQGFEILGIAGGIPASPGIP